MEYILHRYPFRCVLSLEPIMEFWDRSGGSSNGGRSGMPKALRQRLAKAPNWRGLSRTFR